MIQPYPHVYNYYSSMLIVCNLVKNFLLMNEDNTCCINLTVTCEWTHLRRWEWWAGKELSWRIRNMDRGFGVGGYSKSVTEMTTSKLDYWSPLIVENGVKTAYNIELRPQSYSLDGIRIGTLNSFFAQELTIAPPRVTKLILTYSKLRKYFWFFQIINIIMNKKCDFDNKIGTCVTH